MLLTAVTESSASTEAVSVTDWITAASAVLALIISASLGAWSIALTTGDKRERRSADEERRTRLFGYGSLEDDGVRVRLVNATDFPMRNVSVHVFSFISSPEPKVLSSGTQTTVPGMPPGSEEELWFGFAKHSEMVGMMGQVGLRIGFMDINGQAWVRRPDGRILKQEELKGSAGFDLPKDMYSYQGPHTSRRSIAELWRRRP